MNQSVNPSVELSCSHPSLRGAAARRAIQDTSGHRRAQGVESRMLHLETARRLVRSLVMAATVVAASSGLAAEEIDKLLAAVNGRVITESDLRLATGLNVLVGFGRSVPAGSRKEQVDHLINREILRQELENFPLQPEDRSRADQRLTELRQAYAEIGGINHVLRGLGLQEAEIEDYLQLQVSLMRFIEIRFRPFINVTDDEIRKYFDEQLLPVLKAAGTPAPRLEEVSEQIKTRLIEEKVGREMDEWIRDLRGHSRIELYADEEVG